MGTVDTTSRLAKLRELMRREKVDVYGTFVIFEEFTLGV